MCYLWTWWLSLGVYKEGNIFSSYAISIAAKKGWSISCSWMDQQQWI